jgi:hypothetical protein
MNITKLLKGLLLILILLFIGISPVYARNIYVAPNGNDSSQGTIDQPLATFQGARDIIRTLGIAGKEHINVYFRGGTYEVANSVLFEPKDSGSADFPITYQGYQNETAILSGGKVLTGWQTATANGKVVWQTTIPAGLPIPRELFINSVRADRDRKTVNGWTANATGYKISSPLGITHPEDLEVVAQVAFRENRCGVTGASGTQVVMKQPCWNSVSQRPIPAYNQGFPSWIENAYELLNTPGQWYADPRTRVLYYIPKSGENPNQLYNTIPNIETIINIQGSAAIPVRNLNFKKLQISFNTWLGANSTDGVSDWVVPAASININYGQNITLDSLNFFHLGGSGIGVGGTGNSTDVLITNSNFKDISGDGIRTTGGGGLLISNNTIINVGKEYAGSFGIWVAGGNNNQVTHNTLSNLPYSGIMLSCDSRTDTNLCPGNIISSNKIANVMQVLTDGGGIYSLSGVKDLIIEKNVITQDTKPFGAIYLDDFSMYKTVRDNVLFDNLCTLIGKGGKNTYSGNYWQDRGSGTRCPSGKDINTYVGNAGCKLNNITVDCGPNTFTGNHIITSLSQAPQAIVNDAGAHAIAITPTLTPIPTPTPIPGDYIDDNDLPGDQVNIFDYNYILGYLRINPNTPYTIFDYKNVVENFGL